MNISLAGGKLPVTPKHAVVWTTLKKPSRHINSFISYQSAFFLSCLLVTKCWCCSKGTDFLPQEFCTHLSSPTCSCLPHPRGFCETSSANPKVFMARSSSICHLAFWTLLQQNQMKGTDFGSRRLLWSSGKTPTSYAKVGFAHLPSVPGVRNCGCLTAGFSAAVSSERSGGCIYFLTDVWVYHTLSLEYTCP